jgi:hypothetical protein
MARSEMSQSLTTDTDSDNQVKTALKSEMKCQLHELVAMAVGNGEHEWWWWWGSQHSHTLTKHLNSPTMVAPS